MRHGHHRRHRESTLHPHPNPNRGRRGLPSIRRAAEFAATRTWWRKLTSAPAIYSLIIIPAGRVMPARARAPSLADSDLTLAAMIPLNYHLCVRHQASVHPHVRLPYCGSNRELHHCRAETFFTTLSHTEYICGCWGYSPRNGSGRDDVLCPWWCSNQRGPVGASL